MSLAHGFVIGLLVALNALYVAAEFAAIAAQPSVLSELVQQGDRRAKAFIQVVRDRVAIDRYIAACQIGITLSSLGAGAYAQSTIGLALGGALASSFGLDLILAHSISTATVLLGLTALQVVLGELIPKSVSLEFPERVALLTYTAMRWSIAIYAPFIWALNGTGFVLLRPFGIRPGGQPHVHSPEELELLFAESRRGGQLSPELHRRLQHGLHLARQTVRHLMVPRSQVEAIEAKTPDADILRQVLASNHSRFPVYRDTLDQVLGSVSAKDIVTAYVTRGELPPLVQLLRPLPSLPESLGAYRMLARLQEQGSSKALVVNERGSVQGMISVDDLLTELFGDLGEERKSRVDEEAL